MHTDKEWNEKTEASRFIVVYLDDDNRLYVDNKAYSTMPAAFNYAKTIAPSRNPLVYKICDPLEESGG